MNFLSIDIETTGLDPDCHQMLEVAAVIDGSAYRMESVADLPYWTTAIRYPMIVGEPMAMAMNHKLLDCIGRGTIRTMELEESEESFLKFLNEWFGPSDNFTGAGKNFASFDRQFLRRLWPKAIKRCHHRSIDPAAYFIRETDTKIPSTELCISRTGFDPRLLGPAHDALADARNVCQLLRETRSQNNLYGV